MIRRRRGFILICGISIFIFFQLHRKLSSTTSESNIKERSKSENVKENPVVKVETVVEPNKEEKIRRIVASPFKSTSKKDLPLPPPRTPVSDKDSPKKEDIKIKLQDSNIKEESSEINKVRQFEADPEKDAKTAIRFQNRVKLMKSRCPGWKNSALKKNWVINKNFLINYPRKLLVCAVPKAGSTSWHMTIWAMRRQEAGLDPDTKYYTPNDTVDNHHTAEKLSSANGRRLIEYNEGDDDMFRNPPTEKAHRLLLTRHPFARMISGWHQKFLPQSSYAELMFKRYPTLKSYVRDEDPNHKMAWKDFAEFVADTGMRPQSLDYHFTPAVELCKPCEYAYSYILKAESVDIDESWLMRRLNIVDIDVGRKGVPPGGSIVNSNPSDNIKKHMAQLSSKVRQKLYEVYKEDFLMFGYTFDFRTLRSGGFE